jgi:hypothetical protein
LFRSSVIQAGDEKLKNEGMQLIAREEVEMSTDQDRHVSEKPTKQLLKDEKRDKKRKRNNHEKINTSSNRADEKTIGSIGGKSPQKGPSEEPLASLALSGNSSKVPRQNPFSMPSVSEADGPTNGGPVTPPQNHSPSPSLSKKLVQFDDDISDDSDYSPSKRKGSKFSPRHSQSPKGISPKKVSKKDQLESRKRDLEEERRRLPIWTGILPVFYKG